jgi:hypothetical protein
MVPGLQSNIRQSFGAPVEPDVEVVVSEGVDAPELPEISEDLLRIEHEDGSVTISMDGRPVIPQESEAERAAEWFRNLVDEIDQSELSLISNDLMQGIDDDIQSRNDWIEDRAQGLKLLGLKIEIPGLNGGADGAPVEGMSKVRHPLLLEAVLRFQANARSELLPTDGPVKMRNDAVASTLEQDSMATALEKDFNHYLTSVAKEYYPDTDRMLFMLGFGGTSFKKVYFCPLRGRPVSESVDADDLIVNQAATDLSNAKRVTHRTFLRPSTVKRLQILGVYRDVSLSTPNSADIDSVQREKMSQQGISPTASNPDDRDREIYECYCELNIRGFEHKFKGKESGLEIPYRVTIDASTKEILSVVRNYDENKEELPEARSAFVKYTFVPGMGFYDIGLLHILGNTTNAVTAAWREMLDAGMFANFPGFLMADTGARQNTNIFRVPPGGAALVKTGGMPLNQAIMPLPYKEPGQALMNLVSSMVETGQRVGGTSEVMVGEGRADAPVGTTLAMIEQAKMILNSVHKRMHTAQAEEFALLKQCFREHPESFWVRIKRPTVQWNEQVLIQALDDCDLVPQADPNTASHTQRVMKIMALKQLQQANPGLYDPIAIDMAALRAMGWSNPEQFMAPISAQGKMPPEMEQKIAELQIKKQDADTRAMVAQATVAEKMGGGGEGGEPDPVKMADLQLRQQEIEQKEKDSTLDAINRQRDRESRERLAAVRLAEDIVKNPNALPVLGNVLDPGMIQRLESNEQPLPIGE